MKENYSIISEVFIGDPVNFRSDIFDSWLRGYSIEEAVKKIKETKTEDTIVIDVNEDLNELIYEDVLDSVHCSFEFYILVPCFWFL